MFIPIIWYYCIDLQLYEHIIQNSIENFCIKICSWTDNMPLSSKPLFEIEITYIDFLKYLIYILKKNQKTMSTFLWNIQIKIVVDNY